MDKKIFIILTSLLIVLIVVLGIFYAVITLNKNNKTIPITTEKKKTEITVPDTTVKKIIKNNQNKEKTKETVSEDDLKRLAASFAERFGSFSNQSNFRNIIDLRLFMSKEMLVWANEYVNEKRLTTPSDIYYGISTKAVFTKMKNFDDSLGRALVLVKTRRREAVGTTDNTSKIFDQDILIEFVKEGGQWKVRSARWQD